MTCWSEMESKSWMHSREAEYPASKSFHKANRIEQYILIHVFCKGKQYMDAAKESFLKTEIYRKYRIFIVIV